MITILILLVLIVSLVNQIIMLVNPSSIKAARAAIDKVRTEKKDESNPS